MDTAIAPQPASVSDFNATEKIKRGLSDFEHTDPFLVELGAALPNHEELDGLVKTHTELSDSLLASLGQLEAQVGSDRARRIENAQALLGNLVHTESGIGDLGVDKQSLNEVQRAAISKIEDEVGEMRIALVQLHQKDLFARLQRLDAAEQRLSNFLRTFPTPLAYLEAQALSSPERVAYHATVSHAGPGALITLARVAIQTGNRALGAAVAARLGNLPEGDRKFTATQLARKLVGAEHGKFVESAEKVRAARQAASNALSQFQMGKPIEATSHNKIKNGLLAGAGSTVSPAKQVRELAALPRSSDGRFAKSDSAEPNRAGVKGSGKWDTIPATLAEAQARAAAEAAEAK
jgi:hypothetical protein